MMNSQGDSPMNTVTRKAHDYINDAYFECECGNRVEASHFEAIYHGRNGEVLVAGPNPWCFGYDRGMTGVTHQAPMEMRRRTLA